MSNTTSPSQTYRVTGTLTLRVHKRDAFRCVYCGACGVQLTIDHVRPASWFPKGTARAVVCDPSNLVTACERCNSHDKGGLSLNAYAEKLVSTGVDAKTVRAMVARVKRAMRKALPEA